MFISVMMTVDDGYTPNYFPLCHSISSTKPSAIGVKQEREQAKQYGLPSSRRPPINVKYVTVSFLICNVSTDTM